MAVFVSAATYNVKMLKTSTIGHMLLRVGWQAAELRSYAAGETLAGAQKDSENPVWPLPLHIEWSSGSVEA